MRLRMSRGIRLYARIATQNISRIKKTKIKICAVLILYMPNVKRNNLIE